MQRISNITVDGIVGEKTFKAIAWLLVQKFMDENGINDYQIDDRNKPGNW